MATEYAAFGTLLQIGDSTDQGTANYTSIAQVQDIGGPSLALNTDDVTAHDSAGGWMEFVGTVKDGGEVSFDIVYDPAEGTHENSAGGLLAELDNKTAKAYKIVFPDTANTAWTFNAFVTAYEPAAPVDGKLAASVTLKVSGQPTLD
jgi:predicted secreted protein